MNTHADKIQKTKSQTVANAVSQKQSGAESTFQFVDNRPEAITQRKLQEMADNSQNIYPALSDTSQRTKRTRTVPVIQRAEVDAVAKANQVDPGNAYASWGAITTTRDAREAARDAAPAHLAPAPDWLKANWKAIADAYVEPPVVDGVQLPELYARATYLATVDARHWSEPQARREGEALLNRFVAVRTKIQATTGQPNLADVTGHIDALKNHFLMPVRSIKASRWDWWTSGGAAQTSLEMPAGGNLDLFNKKEPTSGRTVALGEGGAGYGRHGRFDDGVNPAANVFVKKQKMKKTESTFAQQRGGTPVFEHPPELMTSNLGYVQEEQEKFRAELTLAMALNHPNVGKTYAGAISVGSGGVLKGYMVQEMISGGDLQKAIARNSLTDPQKITVMKGALDGLAHLHQQGHVHRDIKAENIMIAGDGTAKLIDFGESQPLDVNGQALTDTRAGTAGYYHPNILNPPAVAGHPAGTIVYDVSTDLFALKTTFNQLGLARPGFPAWLATFDNAGETAAALRGTANAL